MNGPFTFVATYKLKDGQVESYKEWAEGLCAYVESNEPRLIAFNLYLDDEGSSVTAVQVHPDAESMASHMQVVRDYITQAYGDFLESPDLVLVCGGSGAVLETIRQMTPSEVTISTMPQHIGGFTRSSASA